MIIFYSFIVEKYPSIVSADELSQIINKKKIASIPDFFRISQLFLDIFIINGYALSAKILYLPTSTTKNQQDEYSSLFQVSMKAPANLWSSQTLAFRRDLPVNDFEIKVLDSLARLMGLRLKVTSTETVNQIDIMNIIRVSAGKA